MSKARFYLAFVALIFLLGQAGPAHGYVVEGPKWPNGNVTMNVQLDRAGYPYPEQPGRGPGGLFSEPGLQDFSSDWNEVALDAIADWNQYLQNVQLVSNENTAITPTQADGVNTMYFASTIAGQSFGSDAIAVTLLYTTHVSSNVWAEADVVVNTAYSWDSYRGNIQFPFNEAVYDLRRVLDHELGHVLGLNHPDQATPPQTVNAIMNSATSNLDHIEVDDIQGIMAIYGTKTILEPITVTASPSNGGTVTGNGNFQLGSLHQLTATPAPGFGFLQWEDGSTNPTRTITVGLQGGTYTATFADALDAWTTTTVSDNSFGTLFYISNKFVAIGASGASTSTDGTSWQTTTPANSVDFNDNAVAYHNGLFVSVGTAGQIWTSTDGVNWTARPTGLTEYNFGSVIYANGLFVAVGGTSVLNAQLPVITSPDGITWTLQTSGTGFAPSGSSFVYSSITYGNGMFVAVGGNFSNTHWVITSPDAVNWTITNTTSEFTNIIYGDGLFLAADSQGDLETSPDGINWTPRESTQLSYIYGWRIAYANGTFIGMSDSAVTSPDGIHWTSRNAGQVNNVSSIAFGGGRFVAIGLGQSFQSAVVPLAPAPVLPVINSNLSLSRPANGLFTYQISATNSPLVFNAFGLPPGLTIDPAAGYISGAPTSTGTFHVTLVATNDAGSGTANLTLTIVTAPTPQNFTEWETAYSFTGNPTDTPRNDGVPNFLKYLYDIDPTVPMSGSDRAALPVVGGTTSNGTDYITLTFRQNPVSSGLPIGVETSTDLQNWQPVVNPVFSPVGTDPTTGDTMMQVQVPITGSSFFIRLAVPTP